MGCAPTSGFDFLPASSHPDHDTLTPSLMARFKSCPHDCHIPGAVKSVVTSTIGQLDELLFNGSFDQFIWIDEMCRSKFERPVLFGIVDIDNNNPTSLLFQCALYN